MQLLSNTTSATNATNTPNVFNTTRALERLLALKRAWNNPEGSTLTVYEALKRLRRLTEDHTIPLRLRQEAEKLQREIILHNQTPQVRKKTRKI